MIDGMPPMRPVDHVPEPPAAQGFWYRTTGWKDHILQAVWVALILVSAVVAEITRAPAWTWWLHGALIIVAMVLLNQALKSRAARDADL